RAARSRPHFPSRRSRAGFFSAGRALIERSVCQITAGRNKKVKLNRGTSQGRSQLRPGVPSEVAPEPELGKSSRLGPLLAPTLVQIVFDPSPRVSAARSCKEILA